MTHLQKLKIKPIVFCKLSKSQFDVKNQNHMFINLDLINLRDFKIVECKNFCNHLGTIMNRGKNDGYFNGNICTNQMSILIRPFNSNFISNFWK